MRFYLYILFFLMMGLSYSQTKQVIIIQHKYDFQTEPDAYNINNMFKGILLAEGFDVYFDDEELPLFVAQNRCNALNGVVLDKSNVFITKLKFVLKDCQNKILFESAEVKSKEKNIQKKYGELEQRLMQSVSIVPVQNMEIIPSSKSNLSCASVASCLRFRL